MNLGFGGRSSPLARFKRPFLTANRSAGSGSKTRRGCHAGKSRGPWRCADAAAVTFATSEVVATSRFSSSPFR
jgi:hypothetical protein